MINYKAIGGSAIGVAIIALIAILNYEVTSDTYYCPTEPEKLVDCFGISGGLHTRCYLNELKTSYDYCKDGWLKALDFIEPILPYNIQDCVTRFWNTTKNIYSNQSHINFSTSETYYTYFLEDIIITNYNETTCKDSGKVFLDGKEIGYKDSVCKLHSNEIHCDLAKDKYGGGADSNKDGYCQSGEDDCQIIKINEDKSTEIIKESRHRLE